jgi:hypothetical protein
MDIMPQITSRSPHFLVQALEDDANLQSLILHPFVKVYQIHMQVEHRTLVLLSRQLPFVSDVR